MSLMILIAVEETLSLTLIVPALFKVNMWFELLLKPKLIPYPAVAVLVIEVPTAVEMVVVETLLLMSDIVPFVPLASEVILFAVPLTAIAEKDPPDDEIPVFKAIPDSSMT